MKFESSLISRGSMAITRTDVESFCVEMFWGFGEHGGKNQKFRGNLGFCQNRSNLNRSAHKRFRIKVIGAIHIAGALSCLRS